MTALQSVVMPKLGLTMTEGVLAEWKVAPGDAVSAGDVIFVVETDKISNEIEAQADGVVAQLHAAEGEVLPVGAVVLSLQVEGEGADPPRNGEGDRPQAGGGGSQASAAVAASPVHHAASRRGPHPRSGEVRVIATPLARRMAAEAGLDLANVSGSGPRGRIMAEDIAASRAVAEPIAPSSVDIPNLSQGTFHELGAYQRVAARRLTEAKRDIPHFYVFADADVTDLLALREQLNGEPGAARLTVNSFVVAALARTLRSFPAMNRIWADERLRELATIDIGMAVEGPKGLVAPVVRDLGEATLDEIAAAADAVVARARAGRLAPQDLEGGAVAVSNVGMFGVTGLLPIINPGQSSIVGVGAAQPTFRPDADGRPVLRQVLHLALSCDHRVIDGALAARFLHAVCRQLETSATLLRRPRKEG